MSAAGKKNRLKMKYPMKLWPFRPATRAGQKAMAIQMIAIKIHQRTNMAASSQRPYGTLMFAAEQQRRTGRPPEEQPPVPLPRCPDKVVKLEGTSSGAVPPTCISPADAPVVLIPDKRHHAGMASSQRGEHGIRGHANSQPACA